MTLIGIASGHNIKMVGIFNEPTSDIWPDGWRENVKLLLLVRLTRRIKRVVVKTNVVPIE